MKGKENFEFESNQALVKSFEKFLKAKLIEIQTDEYEEFNDYLEMII